MYSTDPTQQGQPMPKRYVKVAAAESKTDSDEYSPPPLIPYPQGDLTRTLSLVGIALSWCLGIACFIAGIFYALQGYENALPGWTPIKLNRNLKEVLPLLINVLVVILEYAMGYGHSVALRWALGDKLIFNSNLRLFTYPKGYFSLGFLSNFLNGGFLVLTYTSTSFLFCTLPIPEACHEVNRLTIDADCTIPQTFFCPTALLCIGLGLMIQAFLVTCQLRAVSIVSWDSNPISTAWAIYATGRRQRIYGRSMIGVHDSRTGLVIGPYNLPSKRQRRLVSAHPEVRRVLIYLWIVVLLGVIWFVAIYFSVKKCAEDQYCISDAAIGSDWSLIPDSNGLTSLFQIDFVDESGQSNGAVQFTIALTLIVQMGFQAFLTMALHCVELLVNTSRDEDTWRSAASHKGYKNTSSVMSTITSWKAMLLLGAKPFIHWLFGMAIQFYNSWGLFLRPPQILYMSIAMLLIALFGTLLCLTRPKGPQPAAYGHLQTLINLIDVYDLQFFWGDKGFTPIPHLAQQGIRHAGTWGTRLPGVDFGSYYI